MGNVIAFILLLWNRNLFFFFLRRVGEREYYERVSLVSHFERAQLMSVWCALASQCRFSKSGGPVTCGCVHYDCSFSLCAHISRRWGGVRKVLWHIYSIFFSSPYLTSLRSGFPATFLPSRLTIGGGVSWRKCSVSKHVCCSWHSFLFDGNWRNGRVEWTGGGGNSISLSVRLSFIRHPSLPPLRLSLDPALRCSLLAFYRTADTARRFPTLRFFSSSVLPPNSRLMVLPLVWLAFCCPSYGQSSSFLASFFPSLVAFTCSWASILCRLCASLPQCQNTQSYWQFTYFVRLRL